MAERIDRLLDEPQLAALVKIYFDPGEPFAGDTFDRLGEIRLKRASLVPICDRVVERCLRPRLGHVRRDLAEALQDADRRDRIDALGAGLNRRPSTLRPLDVAI